MRKINFLRFCFIILGTFNFFSCKKSVENVSRSSTLSTSELIFASNYLVDPKNELNDLDFVGQLHNECLEIQAEQLYLACNKQTEKEEVKKRIKHLTLQRLSKHFGIQLRNSDIELNSDFLDYQKLNENLDIQIEPIGFLENRSKISITTSSIYKEISRKLKLSLDSLEFKSNDDRLILSNAVEDIIKEEMNYINNPLFTRTEQTQLKVFFSILRHSIVYHISNAKNDESYWTKIFINKQQQRGIIAAQKSWGYFNGFWIYCDWTDIAVQDAIWGASGIGTGANGGLAGALAGAIFGGSAGSASALWTQMNSGGVIIIYWGVALWP